MDKEQLHILIITDNESECVITHHLISELKSWVCLPEWATYDEEALISMTNNLYNIYLIDSQKGVELTKQAIKQGGSGPIVLLLDKQNPGITSKIIEQDSTSKCVVDCLEKKELTASLLEHTIRQTLKHDSTLKAFQQSETRYQQLLELFPNGIAIYQKAHLVFVNAAGAKLMGGNTLEYFIGKSIRDFIHPNYQDIVHFHIENILQNQQPVEGVEIKVIRPNGQSVKVEITLMPIIYQNKTSIHFSFKDISQSKQTEIETMLATRRKKQYELTKTLTEANIILTSRLDFNLIIDQLLDQIHRIVPYDAATVTVVEGNQTRITHKRGYEQFGEEFTQGIGQIGLNIETTTNLQRMVETKQPLVVTDTSTDSNWVKVDITDYVRSWIGAPIIVQEQVVAFFSLDKIEPRFYQAEHAEMLAIFADQITLALENARLSEAVQEAHQLSTSLRETSALLVATLDLEKILNRILDGLRRVIPYDSASIMLIENDSLRIIGGRGIEATPIIWSYKFPINEDTINSEIYKTKKPMVIDDVHKEPRFIKIEGTDYIRSWIGVPLLMYDTYIGTLTLDHSQPGFYTQEDAIIANAFAQQATIVLENARLFDETYRRSQQLAILNELANKMTDMAEVQELCATVGQQINAVFDYYNVTIFTIDQESQQLETQINIGAYADTVQVKEYGQHINGGLIKLAIQAKEAVIVNNVQQHPDFVELEETHIRSEMVIPLMVGDKLIGVLNVDSDKYDAFDGGDIAALTTIADQLAIAIEKSRLFAETRQRAEQIEALGQVTQDLIFVHDLDVLLQQIMERAALLLQGDGGGIHLYQAEEQILEGVVMFGQALSLTKKHFKPGEGVVGQVWLTGKPLIVNDYNNWDKQSLNWSNEMPTAAVGAPIHWGDEWLGVLSITISNPKGSFTQEDASLLSQFAAQAAVAIKNARLFEAERTAREQAESLREETRQNLMHTKRLYELSTEFASSLSLEDTANLVIEKVVHAMNAHSANLTLLDQVGQFKQSFGAAEPRPRSLGATMAIFKNGQPLIVSIAEQNSHLLHPDLRKKGIESSVGLPLKVREHIIGVLFVRYDQPRQFSSTEVETLFIFANQAAIAIQNARLYEEVQKHATDLEERIEERTFKLQALYELAYDLSYATQPGDVIRLTLLQLYQTVPHAVSASLLLNDTGNTLVIQSQYTLLPVIEAKIQDSLKNTLSQTCGVRLNKVALETHRIQPKFKSDEKPTLSEWGAEITVPILIDKKVAGLLLVATEKGVEFDEEQIRLLHIVANQAADTMSRLQSLLDAEHQRLENLVVHLPNGIILLDSEHRVMLTNQATQKLLPNIQVGEKVTNLGQHSIESILKHANTEAPFVVELEGFPPQVFEVLTQPNSTEANTGEITLVLRDITEQLNIGKRIEQQARMAAVGQLAAGIAHDFNNILTSIIGYAELIKLNPALPPPVTADVERITKQGHRAAHLVRQILDFSRQTITEKQPLDLVDCINETIKLLKRTIPEDINIDLSMEIGQYTIKADPTQIQQVLTNLAVNARDAMHEGGELHFRLAHLTIFSGNKLPHPELHPGKWVVLTVSDTGTGIPAELREQIFEPFFTTKEVGKGTGLGLAQVYGIVKQHEGLIDVMSKVEFGTAFTIFLPKLVASQPAPEAKILSEIPRGQNEVILLVEDDDRVLKITTSMLKHLGYTILTATNGFEALEVYAQHKDEIALILTDLTMPKMGGVELTIELRKRDPEINVIALTGYPLDSDAKKALTEGIVDWLQKPLSMTALGQAVHKSLNL